MILRNGITYVYDIIFSFYSKYCQVKITFNEINTKIYILKVQSIYIQL